MRSTFMQGIAAALFYKGPRVSARAIAVVDEDYVGDIFRVPKSCLDNPEILLRII
ncbi:hypothetical protein [Erythrobacter donghaensis]|jgi:hypothetical protein|uniref:hypothetical protein n=1 Tax=Erythrobacter donghaensis TaxID=267135 RepID=UPI000A64085B|nr:hypothetical protein [Erythrobacter donghaensis]